MYRPHPDFPQRKPVTGEQLEAICKSKVVNVDGIAGPLVIESIEMIQRGKFVFVRTRTKCGLEGISICGAAAGGAEYAAPGASGCRG